MNKMQTCNICYQNELKLNELNQCENCATLINSFEVLEVEEIKPFEAEEIKS